MIVIWKHIILKFGVIALLFFASFNSAHAACSNPTYNAGLWATYAVNDIVAFDDGGTWKDYICHTAGGACANDPNTGPGAACWNLNANPCAPAGTAPTLAATTAATSITATTASSGGNITAQGSSAIIERGVVWNLTGTPTTADNKLVEGGTTTGVFTSSLTSLPEADKIFVRAYGTNSELTGYGAETWFYTGSVTSMTTQAAIDIHCESFTTGLTGAIFGRVARACCGTDALGDLYTEVDEWGIIYGTVEADVDNSTEATLVGACVKDVHISDANGGLDQTDRFQEITGLSPSTTYYFKAYGKHDDVGTGYGTTKSFTTSAACTNYYSCAWDADVDNRWSLNSDCSTADGDALVASNLNAICNHRHDWLSAAISNLDTDVSTEATTRAMTVVPYRMIFQSGSRVVQNNPTFIGGTQIEIQANAQYSHNGALNILIDGTDSDVQGHVARISNAGSLLVDGSYTNAIKMTGAGEFCVYGTFTQTGTAPGSVNGDFNSPPSLPDTRYVNGDCVGNSTLPVELLSFDAVKEKNIVEITWVTGAEINNDYFEVLASADGLNWEVISIVDGAGTSMDVRSYSIIDADIAEYSRKYYKLKQVDFDGRSSYSKVDVVNFSDEGGIIHAYYDGNYVNVFFNGIIKDVQFDMYDINAENVHHEGILVQGKETAQMTVKVVNLSPGIYFIRLNNGDKSFSYKINVP